MSLRLRILLLVLMATLTPAAVLGLYLVQIRDIEIARAEKSLNALAAYAASDLEGKVSGTVQLLHGLSRAPILGTMDKAACSAFLADVLGRYPQYTGLLTIQPDGQLHCDSLASGRILNLNDRAYFQQARTSSEPAFDAVFGRLSGSAVLQVAYPSRGEGGELRYVLLASLNLAQFSARFATASPLPGMEMLIWDRMGTVLVRHPDTGGTKFAGSSQAASDLYRFVKSEPDRSIAELAGPDGVAKIWARSVLPNAAGGGLRITLGVPRDILLADANQDLHQVLSILAGATLLACLAALLFAEMGIGRQVARITKAAARQGAGDSRARIGAPYPRGELGGLMATLDATAASVQAQQGEIGRTSEQLRRSNRTLRMLSAISSTIVRVRGKSELLAESCRIALEEGGFPIAWAGLVARGTTRVDSVAWQGVDEAYVRSVQARSGDAESLVGTVIREKRALILPDTAAEPRLVQREAALKLGSRSMAFLPLLVAGEVGGIFVLHAREAGFFDEQEMKLLHELAGDIGFALEYIEKTEKLDYLAYYDALTGLANRRLFLERVAQYMRGAVGKGHKLALFFLDLERFRNINDSLGRPAGDLLLKQVAQWLTREVGDVSLLAHLGMDHFAIVLPEVKQEGDVAHLLDKRIRAFIEQPFSLDGTELRVSLKVGVAVFPNDGTDADTLLRNAEAALKKAKASGERCLFYNQGMTAQTAGNLTLENQLREALDKGEFVLHYQPKIHLDTGKLTGAEALIRWNNPRSGLVPPGQFIPILEETGLIYEVGRWALRQAITDYLRWRGAGLPAVRVAVNVSPMQLRNRGFVAEVQSETAIDPHAAGGLELEITESLIMEDVKRSIESLRAIRAMGVRIAIDDFGTGFSSLSYLAKLPVDTLKIDRSFVIDMTRGPDGLALVSTIISLAHSLKLNVVAEGVETDEQARLLRLLRCDEMQGFLFSQPLPAGIFEARFLGTARSA